MTRTLLTGFAALALTVMAWPADQALAISHGCTDPPDIKSLTLDVEVDGKTTQVKGTYCSAMQQAAALVDRSSASRQTKQQANTVLTGLKATSGDSTSAATGSVGGKLTCDSNGNCSGSLTVQINF